MYFNATVAGRAVTKTFKLLVLLYACSIGMSDLPDMYAQSPMDAGQALRVNISSNSQMPLLQLICNIAFSGELKAA